MTAGDAIVRVGHARFTVLTPALVEGLPGIVADIRKMDAAPEIVARAIAQPGPDAAR